MLRWLLAGLGCLLVVGPIVYDLAMPTAPNQHAPPQQSPMEASAPVGLVRENPASDTPNPSRRVYDRSGALVVPDLPAVARERRTAEEKLALVAEGIERLSRPLLSEESGRRGKGDILAAIRAEESARKLLGKSLQVILSEIRVDDPERAAAPVRAASPSAPVRETSLKAEAEKPATFSDRYLEPAIKMLSILTGLVTLVIVLRKEKRDTSESRTKLVDVEPPPRQEGRPVELRSV